MKQITTKQVHPNNETKIIICSPQLWNKLQQNKLTSTMKQITTKQVHPINETNNNKTSSPQQWNKLQQNKFTPSMKQITTK